MTGWLVNDVLTCIPNTKTLWHDLLDWIPSLEDKTGTPFPKLAETTERLFAQQGVPDYIIRNATFFRRLDTDAKTISYLQDHYQDERYWHQIEVCDNSAVTVFNSSYTHDIYASKIDCEVDIIPIGTDFKHFCATEISENNLLPDSVLYVGSADVDTKRFDVVLDLIEKTKYNFCLVMKDEYTLEHPRVKVYNKVDHNMLKQIYNQSAVLVCPSRTETLHLAGIEAGACGTPIVANQVGVYDDLKEDDRWGVLVKDGDFKNGINTILKNRDMYDPRSSFLEAGLDKETCQAKWLSLVKKITR